MVGVEKFQVFYPQILSLDISSGDLVSFGRDLVSDEVGVLLTSSDPRIDTKHRQYQGSTQIGQSTCISVLFQPPSPAVAVSELE